MSAECNIAPASKVLTPTCILTVSDAIAQGNVAFFANSTPEQLQSAAIGYLVHGARNDSKGHILQKNTFHPEYLASRQEVFDRLQLWRMRQTIADHHHDTVTKLDRLNMGFTLTMSVTGGIPPGTQKSIEALKINVYVPPGFVEERPFLKTAVAKIVQQFTESIGVEVMDRYDRAAGRAGWPMSSVTGGEHEASSRNIPIFPAPVSPGSSTYVFWGRPVGQLDELIAASNGHASVAPGARSAQASNGDVRTSAIVQYLETIDRLTHKNQSLERRVQVLTEEVASLQAAEQRRKDAEPPVFFGPHIHPPRTGSSTKSKVDPPVVSLSPFKPLDLYVANSTPQDKLYTMSPRPLPSPTPLHVPPPSALPSPSPTARLNSARAAAQALLSSSLRAAPSKASEKSEAPIEDPASHLAPHQSLRGKEQTQRARPDLVVADTLPVPDVVRAPTCVSSVPDTVKVPTRVSSPAKRAEAAPPALSASLPVKKKDDTTVSHDQSLPQAVKLDAKRAPSLRSLSPVKARLASRPNHAPSRSIHIPGSPVSVSSESSISSTSCAASLAPSTSGSVATSGRLIRGFGRASASYLKQLGKTKYAHVALKNVFDECPWYSWAEELTAVLGLTDTEADKMVRAMIADCSERGIFFED